MLLMPAIDLRGGRCVRLLKGDFEAETAYPWAPGELLGRYRALGARWIHVVDLDGARAGSSGNREAILELAAEGGVRLQAGGGVRGADALAELLAGGVARVVIGSAAIESPAQVAGWLERFGPERICLALDVRLEAGGEPLLRTRGWLQDTGTSLWDLLDRYPPGLVRHVLCTDIERDGALLGANLDLYRAARARFPGIAWQASGGVCGAPDLRALAAIGVAATVSGKALLEQRIPTEELEPFLRAESFPASTCATVRS
jgi:phosphoribosylformimino-5-aminoimidazole carboxamide ribotide isomerase